jgi:all-trans-retinol 13,14-reductase
MDYLSSFSSSLSSMNLKDEFVVASTTFTLTALLPSLLVRTKHRLNELSQSINNQEIRKKRSLLHEKFNPSKLPSDIDYIVIGSGMGGLTTAAILSRLGRKVVVLEQHHDVAGGGTHMFDLKGYVFDSGLHYTVPWSGPLFALTCLKKPKDCIPFDLMLEKDGTIDKVYLVEPDEKKSGKFFPFDLRSIMFQTDFFIGEEKSKLYRMRYHETHFKDIYDEFPEEKAGIDRYLAESDNAMLFVKIFIFARLLPRWLQRIYWFFLPSSVLRAVQSTASDLLPQYTSNKRLASLFSSMWIDTGARPDKATFMLTASVFRGISMEGGCYPRGGSTEMAKELVTVIEVRFSC